MRDLTERINAELKGREGSSIAWLMEHLAEYIQRWNGFARLRPMGVSGTLETDAFSIILATVRLIDNLLEQEEYRIGFPCWEWSKFEEAIEHVQSHPSEDSLSLVIKSWFFAKRSG